MRFIDLFAGLGGFHLGLKRLGHTCVFACEIDRSLKYLYQKNFGIVPYDDIRQVTVASVPSHDILCAGFPCQPFSKAGDQQGLDCPKWGDLFDQVIRIARHHKPQYIILENVANLENHDDGKTWQKMYHDLTTNGYNVRQHRLSPHQFGIPQIRDRMFIVGSRSSLDNFTWPQEAKNAHLSIFSALDDNPPDARGISLQVAKCLDVWQEFLDSIPKEMKVPSFPIWSMEFGATYPFKTSTPYATESKTLRKFRGSHGHLLTRLPREKLFEALPSHARTEEDVFPNWKIRYIQQNREFYHDNHQWLDNWIPKILEFPSSLQKFEWNCQGAERNLWKLVIQFRASGVRVKLPTTSPSLVSMTTQVPIIGWKRRYMTPRECARLQSMGELKYLPEVPAQAFRALGNAVNVDLVAKIAEALILERRIMIIPPVNKNSIIALESCKRN